MAISRRGEKYIRSVLLGVTSKFDAIELGKLLNRNEMNYVEIILDGNTIGYEEEGKWEHIQSGYNKTYRSFEDFDSKWNDDYLELRSAVDFGVDWSLVDVHLCYNTFILRLHVTDKCVDSWWEINPPKNIFGKNSIVDEEDMQSVIAIIEKWELDRLSNKKRQVKQEWETQKYLIEKTKQEILHLFECDYERHTLYSIYKCIDFSNEFDSDVNDLFEYDYKQSFCNCLGYRNAFNKDVNEEFYKARNYCVLETCLTTLVNENKIRVWQPDNVVYYIPLGFWDAQDAIKKRLDEVNELLRELDRKRSEYARVYYENKRKKLGKGYKLKKDAIKQLNIINEQVEPLKNERTELQCKYYR